MKGVALKSGRHRKDPEIPCGEMVTILAKRPYRIPSACGRWECEKCRNDKIEMYQEVLRNAQLVIIAYVSRRPTPTTTQEKNDFKNFLKRKVEGQYWWFKSDLRSVIISRCKHPGSVRMLVKDIIGTLVPEILNESYAWWRRDRFGKSRDDNKKRNKGKQSEATDNEKVSNNPVYGKWISHGEKEKDDAVFYECRNFRGKDYKWYQWLKKHRNDPEIMVCKEGHKLIKRFEAVRCGDEVTEGCAARLAAPPRYAL